MERCQGCKVECEYDYFHRECTLNGLCDDCRYRQYPDEFSSCLFCRRVQRYRGWCVVCSPVIDYINQSIVFLDTSTNEKEACIYHVMSLASPFDKGGTPLKPIHPDEWDALPHEKNGKFMKRWPGFYSGKVDGTHTWTKPELKTDGKMSIIPLDIKRHTWKQRDNAINQFLESRGVFIHSEIQYIPPTNDYTQDTEHSHTHNK